MNSHAPEPWNWQTSETPSSNGDFHLYVIDANGRKIAAVWGRRGEKMANAELMSLAPSMASFIKERARAGDAEAAKFFLNTIAADDP